MSPEINVNKCIAKDCGYSFQQTSYKSGHKWTSVILENYLR
jgi:hypothetical protein